MTTILLGLISVALVVYGIIFLYTELNYRLKKKTEISFHSPDTLMLGDLHCHSIYSEDGVFTVEQIGKYISGACLDFVAITDHNENKAGYCQDKIKDSVLIPGSECSLVEHCGHFNVFGIYDIELAPDMTEHDEIVAYMQRMKDKGARIQINHPFHNDLGWFVGWDVPYNYVEVWNRTYNQRNANAIAWWHEQLCQGKKITATGGTDAHTTKSERSPINGIFCKEKTSDGILEALDKGHNFVTESAMSPFVQLKMGDASMGDTVNSASEDAVEFFVKQGLPGYTVKIISDQGVEVEEKMTGSDYYKALTQCQGRKFFRLEVWRSESMLTALSNPIYLK